MSLPSKTVEMGGHVRFMPEDDSDICNMLYNEYELEDPPLRPLLFCNREPYQYHYSEMPVITEDHVNITKHDEEGVDWNFDISETGSAIDHGSSVTGARTIPFLSKYKIRHEFVAEAINRGSCDKPLDDLFGTPNTGEHYTPDFAWTDSLGTKHVLEITTTRADTEDGIKRAYDQKEFKYKAPIENRLQKDDVATFTIIVVSHSFILSTIKLSGTLVTELIIRFRIGVALENKAKSLGLTLEGDTTDLLIDLFSKEIYANLQSSDYGSNLDHPLSITPDYVDSLSNNPNEEEIMKIYLHEIRKTEESAKDMVRNEVPWDEIHDYENANRGPSHKMDLKSVVNLPLFLPEGTNSSTDIPAKWIIPDENVLETQMWEIAFTSYRTTVSVDVYENPAVLMREALEQDVEAIKMYQDNRRQLRNKYHRVKIASSLAYTDRIQAALQGLWAKQHKAVDAVKIKRKHTQLPMSWDTGVEDITDFLENGELLNQATKISKPVELTLDLITKANHLSCNDTKGEDTVKGWAQTQLFQALDFISDVGMELVISNKQNCKTGDAILKKLRWWNAYLLIFPTKSTEHVFFSIYFPRGTPLCGLPFRECIPFESGWVTKLVSAKQGKLENWCSASASLLTLSAFWSWFYNLPDDSPASFLGDDEARRMLLLTLLIRLEDKACTEELITQTRYCYMEMFKGSITPFPPNPFKMLRKFPDHYRSRLQLWCCQRIIKNFASMCKNPPARIIRKESNMVEGEDALPRDCWKGMLNCFTGREVQSASKIINLMYLGYLKNKNESAEGNTDFSLINKTVEEELGLDWQNYHKSRGECDTSNPPSGKQFSKDCIIHGCIQMEKRLANRLGSSWKEHLGQEVIRNLSSHLTEELATLKASSSIKHEFSPSEASYTDPIAAMRVKVIEALHSKLELFKLNPYTSLSKIINYVEVTSQGIIADLFKKQQHGGLREIYVLTIESRIIQLFVETASRTICSYFDEETLTHPRNKLRKLNEHRKLSRRVAYKRNCIAADLCSSTDKTRWNQNFVMPAMVIPLIRMLPEAFHPMLARCLNLWTKKLIRIPQSVCTLLLNRTPLASPTFDSLLKSFWDKPVSGTSIMPLRCSKFVRLSSGMMQGILHYTSSLLHLTFLASSSRITRTILSKLHPDFSFLMTQICSSDDSATVLTVLTDTDSQDLSLRHIKVFCQSSIALESLSRVCKYYCMVDSVKSTVGLLDYVEFNSEFLLENTIAMPVIKFVAASLNISESESFLDRFHTMYNLTSDLFSSGFTAQHTHIVQIAQAYLHYKTMGASTNALFDSWVEMILMFPDPKYGFFLLDCDLIPGALGYSFSHWMACKSSPIFQISKKEITQDPWVTTPEGGIVQSLIIKHGEVKRWRRMAERIVGDIHITEQIEKDPEVLFRKAVTAEELKLKLAIKATSPGVAKSLCRGNPFIQAVAMSVYAINTHSFSRSTVSSDLAGNVTKQFNKVCIYGELCRKVWDLYAGGGKGKQEKPSAKSMLLMFPNSSRYAEAMDVINRLRNANLVHCQDFRNRKSELVVQSSVSALPLTLLSVLSHHWFKMPIRSSNSVFQRCLTIYRETLPWIRSTMKDTLLNSPFSSYQELYNFISTDTKKSRVFRRNGPGLHSRRLQGQIYNLARKSQRPGMVLKESHEGRSFHVSTDVITRLNLALSVPDKRVRDKLVRDTLKTSEKLYDDLATVGNLTPREATLAYMQGIIRGDFQMADVTVHMKDMGLGSHIAYVTEQKRERAADGSVRWSGRGECYALIEGCQLRLTLLDSQVTGIWVDDYPRMKLALGTLKQLLREMGLKHSPDSRKHQRILARYNGVSLAPPDCVGTPVFQLPRSQTIQFATQDTSLRIEHNQIAIVQALKDYRGRVTSEITMLKYHISHKDIILSQKGAPKSFLWDAWVDQSPCQAETLIRYIRDSSQPWFNKRITAWLRETLQSRLQYLSLGSFSQAFQELDPTHYDPSDPSTIEVTDEMMQEIMGAFCQSALTGDVITTFGKAADWAEEAELTREEEEKLQLEAILNYGLEDSVPLWADCVKNWDAMALAEPSSVVMPKYLNFMSLHPLWDDLIQGMIQDRPNFWYEVLDGRVVHGLEEPCKLLHILLNIRAKDNTQLRSSMSERFLKALKSREDTKLEMELMELSQLNEPHLSSAEGTSPRSALIDTPRSALTEDAELEEQLQEGTDSEESSVDLEDELEDLGF